MMILVPLALTFATAAAVPVAKGKAPKETIAEPSFDFDFSEPARGDAGADELDALPPIPSGTKTVTFGVPQPVVGQVCTNRSDVKINLTGPAESLARFGDERGGEVVSESTVLEVRADGKLQKLRMRQLVDTSYGSYQGNRVPMPRATRGRSYVLTRKDEEGWFDAVREDGTAIDEEERIDLRGSLDRRFPGELDGRTMTIGQKVKFSDEELRRYFAFEDSAGMKVKSHEMKLGAIDGDVARIDLKVVFDVNAANGEAEATAWATVRSDLAQLRVTEHVEGPMRIELPTAAAGGLGAPAAPGAAGEDPIVLNGTFHIEGSMLCKLPKRR